MTKFECEKMKMNYKILTGIETVGRDHWTNFLEGHPHATIFQSPEMYDLFKETPNFEPIVLALESADGALKAILLSVNIKDYKGLIGNLTKRTVIYGGPLITPDDEKPEELADQILRALIKAVEKYSLYIQFRNSYDTVSIFPSFQKNSFRAEDHLNLFVTTSDSERTYFNISKSKIRQEKKGFKSGAEVVLASSEEEICDFYLILKQIYKEKVKKPLPDRSFFLTFFRAMQQGKLGIILLAKYNGIIIGGMVCPVTPGKTLNEWYVCGLDKEYHDIHPSVLLTFGAIKYALKKGIPLFDFMGIGIPDKPYGVRDFKIRFGGKTVNYGRYIRINNPYLYPIGKALYFVFSYLHLV